MMYLYIMLNIKTNKAMTTQEIAKRILTLEITTAKLFSFNQKVENGQVTFAGETFQVEEDFLDTYIDMLDEVADYDAEENWMSKESKEEQNEKLISFINTL